MYSEKVNILHQQNSVKKKKKKNKELIIKILNPRLCTALVPANCPNKGLVTPKQKGCELTHSSKRNF